MKFYFDSVQEMNEYLAKHFQHRDEEMFVTEYHPNGSPKTQTLYKNGKRNGWQYGWDENYTLLYSSYCVEK